MKIVVFGPDKRVGALRGELVRRLYAETGHAHAVGFTGPPGVGKSTLISSLVTHLRAQELTVGVISVGVGWATLQKAKSHVAGTPSVTIHDVDNTLEAIADTAGKGSAGEKQRLLSELFSRATAEEQDFLFRLLTGELRQGALEGIMVEALAKAREAELLHRFDPTRHPKPVASPTASQFRGIAIVSAK